MAKNKRKIIVGTIVGVVLVVISILTLNGYLTYRLEDHLRKRLSRSVSNATNGFYRFSFEELSVGWLNGELSIKGITLTPDSAKFREWQLADSLPETYFDIHVDEIYFKGINLAWRKDYKNLKFDLFEINSPKIQIFDTSTNKNTSSKPSKNRNTTDLYETISPYIQVLRVNKINLINASVSYMVDDFMSPSVYALDNINFTAYGFLLDHNSSKSGKLLYCDNFEFRADQPQKLLSNEQFVLTTNHIRLSTIDSIIHIDKVSLLPQDNFWKNRTSQVGDYPKATIETVKMKGIYFKRKDGLRYLDASSFVVDSTDMEYYSVRENENAKSVQTKVKADSLSASWSLYSIVSPVLHCVAIHRVGVENAKFKYSVTQGEHLDTWALDKFSFDAYGFYLDSLSEKQKKFWYVDNFILEGINIKSQNSTKNALLHVDRIFWNTFDKRFSVSNIDVKPLSIRAKRDYASGKIGSINIFGLDYNEGIGADSLNIDAVDLNYIKASSTVSVKTSPKNVVDTSRVLFDVMGHHVKFISVKDITLTRSNISYSDVSNGSKGRLRRFNFYATDFLLNDYTKQASDYFFSYGNLGFDFFDFDGYSPNKKYRLQMERGALSSLGGNLTLRNIKLTPQIEEGDKAENVLFSLSIPLVKLKGFDDEAYIKNKDLKVALLKIESPQIKVIKSDKTPQNTNVDNLGQKDLSALFNTLATKEINISDADISYINGKDSLRTYLDTLHLVSMKWDVKNSFDIAQLIVRSPYIDFHKNTVNENKLIETPSAFKLFEENVHLGSFTASNIKVNVKEPALSLSLETGLFNIGSVSWSEKTGSRSLSVDSINIIEPNIVFQLNETVKKQEQKKTTSGSKNLYTVLEPYVDQFSLGKFKIVDANLEYNFRSDERSRQQQTVNKTNLVIEGLVVDAAKSKFDIADIRFSTKDLYFPIMDGFYTIGIGSIDLNKQNAELKLSNLRMESPYPKMAFAYRHPRHKDWFDVTVGNIDINGIDYPRYFSDEELNIKDLTVKDVVLQNFKNQNIEIEHNLMPMIYEGLQTLPLKFHVDSTHVYDFSVIYEELTRGAAIPGVISFDHMNATIDGLSNIATYPHQFIKLDAEGKLMGTGYFTARWMIPVSKTYDHFFLSGHIYPFDLRDLNRLVTPMAAVEVRSGNLKDLKFATDASSKGATVEMVFLYNDLGVGFLRGGGTSFKDKLFSGMANLVLRTNNPKNERAKPRKVHISVERNAYHSTFNYFWQILQPAVVESVGVSARKQNFAKKVSGFFGKVKTFFSPRPERTSLIDEEEE